MFTVSDKHARKLATIHGKEYGVTPEHPNFENIVLKIRRAGTQETEKYIDAAMQELREKGK